MRESEQKRWNCSHCAYFDGKTLHESGLFDPHWPVGITRTGTNVSVATPIIVGQCSRFPKHVLHRPSDWCGEYKQKP